MEASNSVRGHDLRSEVIAHGVGGWQLEHYQWRQSSRTFFYRNAETAETARVIMEGRDVSVRLGVGSTLDFLNDGGDVG